MSLTAQITANLDKSRLETNDYMQLVLLPLSPCSILQIRSRRGKGVLEQCTYCIHVWTRQHTKGFEFINVDIPFLYI